MPGSHSEFELLLSILPPTALTSLRLRCIFKLDGQVPELKNIYVQKQSVPINLYTVQVLLLIQQQALMLRYLIFITIGSYYGK